MLNKANKNRLKEMMDRDPEVADAVGELIRQHRIEMGTICHELKNPLTLISSSLQLIESRNPSVRSLDHWQDVMDDVAYMSRLLSEFSEYNHSSSLQLSPTPMTDFLKSLCLSFAVSLSETSIEFTSKIDPSLPDACVDSLKLRGVIINLLKNAKEALPADPLPAYKPSIFLNACTQASTEDRGEDIVITVEDNGCGIPEENIDSIFHPFVTYKAGGTGLGLAYCKKIIEAHFGSVSVSSEEGEKTVFTLRLPAENRSCKET